MADDHSPPPETILFVEDEAVTRMDMTDFLRQSGFTVTEAANAAEAVDILNSKLTIDLVITDVKMPGDMDGVVLARWVRENRPGVEVILVSGDTRSIEQLPTSGDGAFLPKPYTGRALLDLVNEALAKRHSPPDENAAGAS
jgi:CheY-like chemotaxis protein